MPSRRPKMPQLGAQDGPGAAQEAPKMRQEPPKSCPRGVQEAAYRRLRAKARHKAAPDSLQTSILDHFGDDLEGFGIIWEGFLEGFWKDFKTNWIHIAPHSRPPLLRGRMVAGTRLCRAEDIKIKV